MFYILSRAPSSEHFSRLCKQIQQVWWAAHGVAKTRRFCVILANALRKVRCWLRDVIFMFPRRAENTSHCQVILNKMRQHLALSDVYSVRRRRTIHYFQKKRWHQHGLMVFKITNHYFTVVVPKWYHNFQNHDHELGFTIFKTQSPKTWI